MTVFRYLLVFLFLSTSLAHRSWGFGEHLLLLGASFQEDVLEAFRQRQALKCSNRDPSISGLHNGNDLLCMYLLLLHEYMAILPFLFFALSEKETLLKTNSKAFSIKSLASLHAMLSASIILKSYVLLAREEIHTRKVAEKKASKSERFALSGPANYSRYWNKAESRNESLSCPVPQFLLRCDVVTH